MHIVDGLPHLCPAPFQKRRALLIYTCGNLNAVDNESTILPMDPALSTCDRMTPLGHSVTACMCQQGWVTVSNIVHISVLIHGYLKRRYQLNCH